MYTGRLRCVWQGRRDHRVRIRLKHMELNVNRLEAIGGTSAGWLGA